MGDTESSDYHTLKLCYRDSKGQFVSKKKVNKKIRNQKNQESSDVTFDSKPPNLYLPLGARIVELETLAESLICKKCKGILSLKDAVHEVRHNLASFFEIKCRSCEKIQTVETCKYYMTGNGLKRYFLNAKAVVGLYCISLLFVVRKVSHELHNCSPIIILFVYKGMHDIGIGTFKLNDFLSALDIPAVSPRMEREFEKQVFTAVKNVAEKSFRKAIQVEKRLTLMQLEQGLANEVSSVVM